MNEVEQIDREAAAHQYLALVGPPFSPADVAMAAQHQQGHFDTHESVQSFAAHRLAERKRCAFVANRIGRDYGEDEVGWSECAETIAAAIFESHRFIFGLSAPDGWQPIETAPKDGTCILLTSDDPSWKYPFPAFWDVAQGCWIFADWPLNDIWAVSDLVNHWQPLPLPPTQEAGRG